MPFETIFDEATTTIGISVLLCSIVLLMTLLNRFLHYLREQKKEESERVEKNSFRTLKTIVAILPLFIVVALFYDDTNALADVIFGGLAPLVLLLIFAISVVEVFVTARV